MNFEISEAIQGMAMLSFINIHWSGQLIDAEEMLIQKRAQEIMQQW